MIEPDLTPHVSGRTRLLCELPALAPSKWQMSSGERAALEGLLWQVKPQLAIEIGTAEGGSLTRIAEHSAEVHSFDLVEPQLPVADLDHVTLHGGDSHELLPAILAEFAEAGRNVDFVLVDGDHSSAGVQRDLEDLLDSAAVQQTVIVVHDINNPIVRAGVDAVRYAAYPKVALVELDCVPGYVFAEPRLRHELWGGLGLVVVDLHRDSYCGDTPVQQRYFPAQPLLEEMRDRLVASESLADGDLETAQAADRAEVEALRAELTAARELAERHARTEAAVTTSLSWRLTSPLRSLMAIARRVLR